MTINEARKPLGLGPRDGGDRTVPEIAASLKAAPPEEVSK